MKKRLLLGTWNPTKIEYFRTILAPLSLELLSLSDLKVTKSAQEDGRTPEENAGIKARSYYAEGGMPTLAVDAALSIDKFPEDLQPGVYVRRINALERQISDAELLAHYVQALKRVGGTSPGQWHIAICLAASPEETYTQSCTMKTLFTAERRGEISPGLPLDVLMRDPASDKYFSEMSYPERPDSAWIFEFVARHLQVI